MTMFEKLNFPVLNLSWELENDELFSLNHPKNAADLGTDSGYLSKDEPML